MGMKRGRSRGGRRRGAMGRTRGERSDWDGQRHSVLERLGWQDMKGGVGRWRGGWSGRREGLGIDQIERKTRGRDGGKRRGGMVRCKRQLARVGQAKMRIGILGWRRREDWWGRR